MAVVKIGGGLMGDWCSSEVVGFECVGVVVFGCGAVGFVCVVLFGPGAIWLDVVLFGSGAVSFVVVVLFGTEAVF